MSKDEAYIIKRDISEADLEKLERITISQHCRIKVLRFASFMEDVLKDNDHKGGWGDCPISYLQHRLVEEIGEYFRSLEMDAKPTWKRKELLDIANYCMMLWDREN